MTSIDPQIEIAAKALLSTQQSLLLATSDAQGEPNASYTPFVFEQGRVYVFTSELSAHTEHLLVRQQASLLIIEDEAQSSNIFARRRLTMDASSREVKREDSGYEEMLDHMENQLGATMRVLRTLKDFHLFELTPYKTRIVLGFGQAHEIDELTKVWLNEYSSDVPCS